MQSIEEQATGCINANSYKEYANKKGYKYIKVVDWTSSAGDWQFIISKDNKRWQILEQVNNYPKTGFSHFIDNKIWYGNSNIVLEDIYNTYL